MRKKSYFYIIVLSFILITLSLSACSDNPELAEEEIKQISKDLILINDENQLEYEAKIVEYNSGEIDDEDYEQFLEQRFIPRSKEVQEYLADYKKPSTKLANEYYDVAHSYISVTTDALIKLGEEQLLAIKDELTEELAEKYNTELQEMVAEYDELREELLALEETLETEHDIRFDIVQ